VHPELAALLTELTRREPSERPTAAQARGRLAQVTGARRAHTAGHRAAGHPATAAGPIDTLVMASVNAAVRPVGQIPRRRPRRMPLVGAASAVVAIALGLLAILALVQGPTSPAPVPSPVTASSSNPTVARSTHANAARTTSAPSRSSPRVEQLAAPSAKAKGRPSSPGHGKSGHGTGASKPRR